MSVIVPWQHCLTSGLYDIFQSKGWKSPGLKSAQLAASALLSIGSLTAARVSQPKMLNVSLVYAARGLELASICHLHLLPIPFTIFSQHGAKQCKQICGR